MQANAKKTDSSPIFVEIINVEGHHDHPERRDWAVCVRVPRHVPNGINGPRDANVSGNHAEMTETAAYVAEWFESRGFRAVIQDRGA